MDRDSTPRAADLAGDLDPVLGVLGGLHGSRPGGEAERVGSGEPRELAAPERLQPRRILFLQPDDVVTERPRRRSVGTNKF